MDQTRAFIAGIRGVTTGQANAINVMVDSSGQLGTVSSSRRYKQNIRPMQDFGVSERIRQLRPVTFEYKQAQQDADGEDGRPVQFGLIAEEVAEVFPELAVFNEEGQPETVKYHLLAPLLLEEVQKQEERVEEVQKLQTENATQSQQLLEEVQKLQTENATQSQQLLEKDREIEANARQNAEMRAEFEERLLRIEQTLGGD